MSENNINPVDLSDNILQELREINDEKKTNDWNFFTNIQVDTSNENANNEDKRILAKCELNHEFFIKNAKAEKKCPTCNSTSSSSIKLLRVLAESIFNKPFYKIYPGWAVTTDSKRKILMNICNMELKIVLDTGGKLSTRKKRKEVCEENKFLYLYVSGKELAESNLIKHQEEIKKHLSDSYHGDTYVDSVLTKIPLSVVKNTYGKLEAKEGEPNLPKCFITREQELELIEICEIDYFDFRRKPSIKIEK